MAQRTTSLRNFLGGFLIAAGSLLLLPRLPWFELDFSIAFWDLWPLFLVAIGISALTRHEWTSGLILVLLGGAFLVSQVSPEIDFGDVFQHWPIALVLVGMTLVLRSFLPQPAPRPKAPSELGSTAFLRSQEIAVESDAYRGNDLIAIMGSHKIDFRQARLAPEGAVIEVFAFWGGIELIVPRDMPVAMQVFPLMGGAEDSSRASAMESPGAPCLTIRGFVCMGGLEIKN